MSQRMKIYFIIFLSTFFMEKALVFSSNESTNRKTVSFLERSKRFKTDLSSSEGDMSTLIDNEESSSDNICDKKEKMVVYYDFENPKTARKIADKSGCDNNGVIDPGSMIFKTKTSCSSIIFLWNHDIVIPSSSFQNPPRDGITISAWLKLQGKRQARGVFSAFGPHFGNLVLEINVPTVIWRFSDAVGKAIFVAKAEGQITQNQNKKRNGWFHLAASYNAVKGIAQVYVNGQPIARIANIEKKPFRYWGNDVRIGGFNSLKPIDAYLDEFKLFNYALSTTEVEFLAVTCDFNNNVPDRVKKDTIKDVSDKIGNKYSDSDKSDEELENEDSQIESLIKEQFEKDGIPNEDEVIDNSDEIEDPDYDQAEIDDEDSDEDEQSDDDINNSSD